MKLFITLIILSFSMFIQAQDFQKNLSIPKPDMNKYLNDTRMLTIQKKYPEALERFIWFHNHALENDPAMRGVRVSFAISYWKDLADVYPPAMEALKEVRDKKTRQLKDSLGTVDLFKDVVAINGSLGLNETLKTIELFEILEQKDSQLAKQCWYSVKDNLFSAKRYDLIHNYIGNPIEEYLSVKKLHDDTYEGLVKYGKSKELADSYKPFNDSSFVQKSVQLIEYSIAVKDLNSAEEIQKKALTVIDDKRLHDAIEEHKSPL